MTIRALALIVLLITVSTAPAAAQSDRPVLIRGARIFDGVQVIAASDVLIVGGRIAEVGRDLTAPAGAEIVEAGGHTLLPGFIDAHTHVFGDALRDALMFGVTTELDMFTDHRAAAAARRLAATDRADLRSAGTLVTAPGGHGTQFGMQIPTLTRPEDASAFVGARLAEGSDYVKIVYDDGTAYRLTLPTLSRATMAAVITAAHARGKLAVVHVGTQRAAREALDAGADGLVHLFADTAPDTAFVASARRHGAFVVPTLTVLESATGVASGARLAVDSRFRPFLAPLTAANLGRAFPTRPGSTLRLEHAMAAVRALRDAGVPILAGTDAPNPGTAHGVSMHRELELLVAAGLAPAAALAAATSVPARTFNLADRGRVVAGLRADLLLVRGDPTRDITATRDIAAVWTNGVRADRAAYRGALAAATAAEQRARTAPAPAGSESGLVSDFDDGTTAVRFGAGWQPSTDAIAGGSSTVRLSVEAGGAAGIAKALAVRGTIAAGLPYAWAGAMFFPGAQPMAPANLSAWREIRFWARGDGRTYRVMLFALSRGQAPLIREFVAGPAWTEYVLPIASFGGIDGHDVTGILIAGGPVPGAFELWVDAVALR